MSNQSLNSLALISARFTHTALEVLSQLLAASLVALCQALDLRALQLSFLASFRSEFDEIVRSRLTSLAEKDIYALEESGWHALLKGFDATARIDANERFNIISKSVREVVLDFESGAKIQSVVDHLQIFTSTLAESLQLRWSLHREAYLTTEGVGDASPFLGIASRRIYEFVRRDLGVPLLHTKKIKTQKAESSVAAFDREDETPTVGYFTSIVYRAVRDGRLANLSIEILRESRCVTNSVST